MFKTRSVIVTAPRTYPRREAISSSAMPHGDAIGGRQRSWAGAIDNSFDQNQRHVQIAE